MMTHGDSEGRIFLAHRIRISDILSMDRKSFLQLFANWVFLSSSSSFFFFFFFFF